jgi:hypothetical protein
VGAETLSYCVLSSFLSGCANPSLPEELATRVLQHIGSEAVLQKLNNVTIDQLFRTCFPHITRPQSYDLVDKLSPRANETCKGLLLKTKLRIDPNRVPYSEIQLFLADLEADKIEDRYNLADAIFIFSQKPDKELLIKLLHRCVEKGGYGPLLHDLPAAVPSLLHEDEVVQALLECQEKMSQGKDTSRASYFWKFLAPKVLEAKVRLS